MTARDQLLLARRFGHELTISTRGEKSWLECTCGYRSTVRRSRSALNSTMAWHLGRAIADGLDQVNGRTVTPGRQQAGGAGAPLPASSTGTE